MIITRTYPGMYYLHIPYEKEKINIQKKYLVGSCDPGVRTLQTIYNPEGEIVKIGDALAKEVFNIYKKVDKLVSKITKTNNENNDDGYLTNKRRRQNMRKQCVWLRTKVKNIVKDLR